MPELRRFGGPRAVALSLMMALLTATTITFAADVKTSDPFPPAKQAAIDAALGEAFEASKAPGKNNPAPTIMKALTEVVTPGNVPQ